MDTVGFPMVSYVMSAMNNEYYEQLRRNCVPLTWSGGEW